MPFLKRIFGYAALFLLLCLTPALAASAQIQEDRVIMIPSGGKYLVIPFSYATPPSAPLNVYLRVSNFNDVTISWSEVIGADEYKVASIDNQTGQFDLVYQGSNLSVVLPSLPYGPYSFYVAACTQSSCGEQVVRSVFLINPNADDDNDGVLNRDDQCTNTPPGQIALEVEGYEGCSQAELDAMDSDFDGVPDYLDAYPQQALGYCPATY